MFLGDSRATKVKVPGVQKKILQPVRNSGSTEYVLNVQKVWLDVCCSPWSDFGVRSEDHRESHKSGMRAQLVTSKKIVYGRVWET